MADLEIFHKALAALSSRPESALKRGLVLSMNFGITDHRYPDPEAPCPGEDECTKYQMARKILAGEL